MGGMKPIEKFKRLLQRLAEEHPKAKYYTTAELEKAIVLEICYSPQCIQNIKMGLRKSGFMMKKAHCWKPLKKDFF